MVREVSLRARKLAHHYNLRSQRGPYTRYGFAVSAHFADRALALDALGDLLR